MRYILLLRPIGFLILTAAAAAGAPERPLKTAGRGELRLDPAALDRAGLAVAWDLDLGLSRIEQIETLSLVDASVYAVTDRGKLYAVRADTGVTQWQVTVADPGCEVFPPTHAAGGAGPADVVVTLLTRVVFLDPATGREKQNVRLDAPASASAVADPVSIYASLATQRIGAYSRKDGHPSWVTGAGSTIATRPWMLADRVIFASDNGRLIAASMEKAAELWTFHLEGVAVEPMFATSHDVVITTTGRYVYSIDPMASETSGGRVRWRYRLHDRPEEGAAVAGDAVYQCDPRQGFLVLDRESGRLRRVLRDGRRLLARGRGFSYILGKDDSLLVMNDADGRVSATLPITGLHFAPINNRYDAVYLADRKGRIVCVRPRNAPPVTSGDMLGPTTTAPAATQKVGNTVAPLEGGKGVSEAARQGDPLRSEQP